MEEKAKTNNVLVIVLGILVLLLAGYLVYDKILNNNNQGNDEACEITKTDYTNFDVTTSVPLTCTIDMTGLTEADVASKCGEDFDIKNDEYQIRVTNLKYNDINYTFTFLVEKDTIVPREDDKGIVKMYIGDILLSARDASLFRIFKSIKVNGSDLLIEESARSDVLPYELNFNLSKIVK